MIACMAMPTHAKLAVSSVFPGVCSYVSWIMPFLQMPDKEKLQSVLGEVERARRSARLNILQF